NDDHAGRRLAWTRRTMTTEKFHATDTSSHRQNAAGDPKGTAVRGKNARAIAKPARPANPLARVAPVALPPNRRGKHRVMLLSTIGKMARIPVKVGPTLELIVITTATSVATMAARTGMSYQRRAIAGIWTWRNRSPSGRQTATAPTLRRNAAGRLRFSHR